MSLKETDRRAGRGEFGLRRSPRVRAILLTPDLGYRHWKVAIAERLGQERGMIVVMADSAHEDRRIGRLRETIRLAKRLGGANRPPRVEMAAASAAEPRSPPAAVSAVGRLVVETALVDGKALQQECGSFSVRLGTIVGQLFQKLGVTKERICRPGSLKGGIVEERFRWHGCSQTAYRTGSRDGTASATVTAAGAKIGSSTWIRPN